MSGEIQKRTGTAIRLTFYDESDEVIREYSRIIIPWGILKRALRLAKDNNLEEPDEALLDELSALVVEVFGGVFTADELEKHADMMDIISVFQQVISKARNVIPENPTPPAT